MSETKYVLSSKLPPATSFLRRYYDRLKLENGTDEFTEKEALSSFRFMTCAARTVNRFNSLVAGDCIVLANEQ